jgi:hypothetical protein
MGRSCRTTGAVVNVGRKGVPKKRGGLSVQLAYWRNALNKSQFENFRAHFCEMMAMPSPALCEAAKFFNLDLKKETERSALLGILSIIIFDKPKKGRPRQHKGKWDVLTLIQLAVDCNNVKANTPGISDKRAAAEIKKRHPGRYKHDSAEMIRQNIARGRVWLENENRIRADRNLTPITLALTRPVLTVE